MPITRANNKPTDDFFSIIQKEERIENPFADDEVLFKDSSGNIRVVKSSGVDQIPVFSSQPALQLTVKVKELTGKPLDLTQEVATVTRLVGIHFNDAEMEKRFKQIVESSLRGVRSQLQTREAFMDSVPNGGLGLDTDHTDKVIKVILQEQAKFNNRVREQVSNEPFADLQAEAAALLSGAQLKRVDELPQAKPVLVFKPAEVVKIKPAVKPVVKNPIVRAQTVPAPKPASITRVVARTDSSKPKIEDVRFSPKLVGPVQEIGSMSVTDFRRLGGTAEQATQKIIEKIAVIEEESFVNKTLAIKAWKDSPVNRLYLELGDESIENKIPISAVIASRQQNNQPFLTEEEVDAVIQLNRKLRY